MAAPLLSAPAAGSLPSFPAAYAGGAPLLPLGRGGWRQGARLLLTRFSDGRRGSGLVRLGRCRLLVERLPQETRETEKQEDTKKWSERNNRRCVARTRKYKLLSRGKDETTPWARLEWVDRCVLITPAPGRQGSPLLRSQPHHRLSRKHGAHRGVGSAPTSFPGPFPTSPPHAASISARLPSHPPSTPTTPSSRCTSWTAHAAAAAMRCHPSLPVDTGATRPPSSPHLPDAGRSNRLAAAGRPDRPDAVAIPHPSPPPAFTDHPPYAMQDAHTAGFVVRGGGGRRAAAWPAAVATDLATRSRSARGGGGPVEGGRLAVGWAAVGGGRPGSVGMRGACRLPPALCVPASSPA